MRKYLFIGLYCLSINTTTGLQIGTDTWINVTHEVSKLRFIDEATEQMLDKALLCPYKKDSEEFGNYQYFHLYVKSDGSRQILEFRLSNYPYKSENLIGFFHLKEYIVFVHEELPIFLKTTDIKKSFSYTEWKIGNLTMREDDTPCWIVEYYDHSFIVLRDPINKLTTK